MLGATTNGADRVGRVLLLGTAIIMTAFVVVFAIGRVTPFASVKALVDIGGEGNLPTWWNAVLLALVAALGFVAWMLEKRRRQALGWAAVVGAAGYLSLDEACRLHERLGGLTRAAGVDLATYAWVLPGAVLALIGASVLSWAGRGWERPTRRRLGASLGIYAAAAVGIEAVNGAISRDGHGLDYAVGTLLEESLEMIACIVAICAIIDHLLVGDSPRWPELQAVRGARLQGLAMTPARPGASITSESD